MPYTIRKQKCTQSDGDKGTYVLSYTTKKGKKVRNCHTSKKNAQGQIAAIEGPPMNSADEPENGELLLDEMDEEMDEVERACESVERALSKRSMTELFRG
jgi:hypothetical protein